MPKIDPFVTASKASAETLFGLAGQTLESVEQLSTLNLQAAKTSLAEFAEGTRAALSAKNPVELVNLQTAALRAAPQKAVAYGRQVKQILSAASAAQRSAIESQVADMQAKFLEAVDGALKNVPGSENTLALVKSAVAAANNAYEGVNNASKQVSDAVDANVTKVTETAVNTSKGALATIED